MNIVYTEWHKQHATDAVEVDGRPLDSEEVPARAEIILAAVRAAGLGTVVAPTDHGLDPILAIHDPDFVAFLQTAYSEIAAHDGKARPVLAWSFAPRQAIRKPKSAMGLKGYYAFGWGTPILEGTWSAAYWSAQCALTAVDLVQNGEPVSYSLCRPPGHHAAADLYDGYCYLNNAAIAARYLQRTTVDRATTPAGRVAILDVDYHHGNGTQMIFYSDPSVLYCSLHVHPDLDYPYFWGDADELGDGPGRGTNRNWPLPTGTDDTNFLTTLDQALSTVTAFEPRYLVVSAGFDTVAGDPVGSFCLTHEGLGEAGRRIAALGLPTVILQEGGYRLDSLGECALAFLRPFLPLSGGKKSEVI